MVPLNSQFVVPLSSVGMEDTGRVGGKNASLGEMLRHLRELKISVPDGFAMTAAAYRRFISENRLAPVIAGHLRRWRKGEEKLEECGSAIRAAIRHGQIPEDIERQILSAYAALRRKNGRDLSVAVRSSATAEDLPNASFAGQLETSLNIRGEKALLVAVRNCFASLFTDRAIAYCDTQKIDHGKVAVSAGVERMVRSDRSGSGVMFTIDTETGFPGVVLINAAWGLGEYVVQGIIDPDEYLVSKPLLADRQLIPVIEKRCGRKEKKLVYGTGSKPTRGKVTSESERRAFVLDNREILTLPAGPWPLNNIMAGQWTSNGQRTAQPASSSSCKRGRKPCNHAGSLRRSRPTR